MSFDPLAIFRPGFLTAESGENISDPRSAYAAPDPAFTFSSTYRKQYNQPAVTLMLNPRSIRFAQGKRFSKQDTMAGSVYHHFSNEAGENNDILELAFEGNTGQIVVPGPIDAGSIKSFEAIQSAGEDNAYKHLQTWHSLYALTREPMYFEENNKKVRNQFFIAYHTHLFPLPVTFTGFFKEVLTFSESADKPRSRDYSMGFIVEDVSPSMNDIFSRISGTTDTRELFGHARDP